MPESDDKPLTHSSPSTANSVNEPARSPVLDPAQLASLRQIQNPGETDFVTQLIELFLEEATVTLTALHEAVISDQPAEIRRLAHRLKGSSGNLGATQMAALAQDLEKNNAGENTRTFLEQLENEFVLVRAALESEREEVSE